MKAKKKVAKRIKRSPAISGSFALPPREKMHPSWTGGEPPTVTQQLGAMMRQIDAQLDVFRAEVGVLARTIKDLSAEVSKMADETAGMTATIEELRAQIQVNTERTLLQVHVERPNHNGS